MIALATLPVLVFGAAAVSRPAPPVPVKLVQTEGVRVIRMDSVTFRARWSPVVDMPVTERLTPQMEPQKLTSTPIVPVRVLTRTPPATEVRYRTPQPVDGEAVVVGTVTGAAHAALPPRHRMRSRAVGLDVCARHGMRRVNYGKRWRCRR